MFVLWIEFDRFTVHVCAYIYSRGGFRVLKKGGTKKLLASLRNARKLGSPWICHKIFGPLKYSVQSTQIKKAVFGPGDRL